MSWLICWKAYKKLCRGQKCSCYKPHKVDLRKKENKWHLYPNPNLHPFDSCRGAYDIIISEKEAKKLLKELEKNN